jgi:RHS repeat-associated protein
MTQIKDESGNITNFGYDTQGNIVYLGFLFEDFDSETTYNYDDFSMISETEYTTSNGVSVSKAFQYEEYALHRLQYIELTIDSLDIKQSFTYLSAHSRINSLSFDFADDGTIEYSYAYIYDETGNIVQESYYERVSSVLTLKRKVYYEYDALNQLVAEDIWVSSGTSYTNVYEYDSRGNRTANYRYQYEFRKTGATIPQSVIVNFGSTEVIPFYDSTIIYSQIKNVDVGGSSELTFTYQDSGSPGTYYEIPTTQLGGEIDSFQKGYYSVFYRATSSYYGIDVAFNVRFRVGNLATTAGTSTNYSTYVYDDEWLDQLASYATIVNGVSTNHVVTYDGQGNPTQITNVKYNGTNYTNAYLDWDGRQLSSIVFATGSTLSKKIGYQYNDQGYRTSKTFYNYGGSQTWLQQNRITYELLGDKVVYETNGTYAMVFNYDYDGTLIGFTVDLDISDGFDGYDFFYIRNQQGDITMIVDNEGTVNAQYQYDAYGKLTVVYESTGGILLMLNPYYYRGYRYDWEIERYYLNSRYYDPAIGRFISSDGLLGQTGDVLSTNMYAYCANNPVMNIDRDGDFAISLLFAGIIVGGIVGGYTRVKNGAEMWSEDFWIGVGTGALIGAAVGTVAGLGGAYLTGGLASVGNKLITDTVSSIFYGTNNYGSWEDYCVAFVIGGLIKGTGSIGLSRWGLDAVARPLLNQVTKMGTRGSEFNPGRFAYDVFTRSVTIGMGSNMQVFGLELNPSKAIIRGLFSGMGGIIYD